MVFDLKANSDKLNALLISTEETSIKIEDCVIRSISKKLLDVVNDNKLNFTEHNPNLGKKARQKLDAFGKASSYINRNKSYHECILFIIVWILPSFLDVSQLIFQWNCSTISINQSVDCKKEPCVCCLRYKFIYYWIDGKKEYLSNSSEKYSKASYWNV